MDIYRDDHKSIYTNYFRTNHLHQYMYTSVSLPITPSQHSHSPPQPHHPTAPLGFRRAHQGGTGSTLRLPRAHPNEAQPVVPEDLRNRKTASRKLQHLSADCTLPPSHRTRAIHTHVHVLNARGGSPEEARRRWERIAREGRPRARYVCIVLVCKANCTGRMGRGVPLGGLLVWMYIHMRSVVRSCDKGGGWCRAGSRGLET